MRVPAQPSVPRAGMLAAVRNRRGVVAGVEPFDGEAGRLHLVHLEYRDDHAPAEERLLWELEPSRHLLEPNALPDPARGGAMPAEDFDALLRAARWTALSPCLDFGGDGGGEEGPDGPPHRQPVASPFHGGVCIESYQLVPLLKALRMPRVSLLIADDVGLGKTIEAGLVLTELLLRRRIRRVLVLTPASLRRQWREELWGKFSLRFEVVDRQETERLRRRLGMDANPWRSSSRIVASFHYLRQPDVLEQFLSACRTPEGSPHLPWDLLIVDECHHLMPSPFGEDSDLCRMLRLVAPQFEHRLFLSATPHNGHTRSFTGLLEMLDPVRFTRTSEMSPAMRGRVEDVVIRRLKRDVDAGSPAPRFCTRRPPRALALDLDPREATLSAAFDAFRDAVRTLVSEGTKPRRRAGTFAVEIFGKRLLSCPTAFAESWSRARQGFSEQDATVGKAGVGAVGVEAAVAGAVEAKTAGAGTAGTGTDGAETARVEAAADTVGFETAEARTTVTETASAEAELAAAERALRQETGDDREAQQREATAASVVGAWLKHFVDDMQEEIRSIERALDALGFTRDGSPIVEQTPVADARFDALVDLIEHRLRAGGEFRTDEHPREHAGSTGAGGEGAGGPDTGGQEIGGPRVEGAGDADGFRTDERLIVFTEYKTTLDYLARRLRERYAGERILTLFGAGGSGGMDETGRENVKAAFNDPASPVRILVATDAASEGLNLHRTARCLLHYDCPWNPSKLEQRNGRLDRYGQARDVAVHHFVSNADPDLRFLDHVIRKADEIREDLGSVNEVFDRAAHRRLIRGEDAASVQAELDRGIEAARGSIVLAADATTVVAPAAAAEPSAAATPAAAEPSAAAVPAPGTSAPISAEPSAAPAPGKSAATSAEPSAATIPAAVEPSAAPTPGKSAATTAESAPAASAETPTATAATTATEPSTAPTAAPFAEPSAATAPTIAPEPPAGRPYRGETGIGGDPGIVEAMAAELDLDARALCDTLDTAMAIPSAGRPQLRQMAEDPGFWRVLRPDLPGWRDVIDEALRRPVSGGGQGPMPRLAFGTEPFIERIGRLRVFLPRGDAVLMHLAHPMMQRALGVLARRRYPGAGGEASRWTVRRGGVPEEAEAVILLSVEELGVNALRETFHRWVRTLALPVRDGVLGKPLAHVPARTLRGALETHDPEDRERAGAILEDAGPDLGEWLRGYGNALTERLRRRLETDGEAARKREDERYRQRRGEVSALIEQSTVARLAREVALLAERRRQGRLFDESEGLAETERSIEEKEEEIRRRRHHYEEIREQLQRERTRVLERLLPARFALAGEAQVFPVAVEVRLPERG